MGDRCGVCSKPMLDLSLSKRVSILNGWGNNTVSSMDIREFFMLRRMPVTPVETPLPEAHQERLGKIAFLSEDLPFRSSGHGLERFAVVTPYILLPSVILNPMIRP